MQNTEGRKVDLYVPRKCCATSRIIEPKDHASVQINVAHVVDGVYTNEYTGLAFSGFVRSKGDCDGHLTRLVKEKGLLDDLDKPQPRKE